MYFLIVLHLCINMETILIDKDIKVFYVIASAFPAGIQAAHEALHVLVPFSTNRRYYGISRPEHGGDIVYRAAAEELYEGEGAAYSCETLVLKKGRYLSITLHDYLSDVQSIGKAFQQILSQPGLDPLGYCVEAYIGSNDVQCMVRMEE